MLGHLRFHRRGQHSSPSSPLPDQLSPFDHAEHPSTVQDISSRPEFLPRPSNPSNTPPVGPSSSRSDGEAVTIRKASEQSLQDAPPTNPADSNFMGGIALRRAFDVNRQDSPGNTAQVSTGQSSGRVKPIPPPINTDLPSRRPPSIPTKDGHSSSSFVAPTDPQNKATATGKRPAGARLTSEPPTLTAAAQTVTETQRTRKGLPFLKNSMSGLLLRRKASQNAPDLHPLPLGHVADETAYQPIRGTRFHDFSAPRTRTVPTRQPAALAPEPMSQSGHRDNLDELSISDQPLPNIATPDALPERSSKSGSDPSEMPPVTTLQHTRRLSWDEKTHPGDPNAGLSATADDAESTRSVSIKSRPVSASSSMKRVNPSTRTNKSCHLSGGDDALSLSALPRHMKSTSSRFSFDMKGISEAAMAEKVLEERHRQKQLEKEANGDHKDSRFDEFDDDAFDYDAAMMGDGLEEEIPQIGDDYDEDDYLHDDAPLEDRIIMVGEDVLTGANQEDESHQSERNRDRQHKLNVEADNEEEYLEEDEDGQDDPDNDQENFAGFVFTRSKQNSSLVSPVTPGMLHTPLDASGRPIGYAFTKEGTPVLGSAMSPIPGEEDDSVEGEHKDTSLAGLGLQGLEAPLKTPYDPTVFQERRNLPPIEDLESGQDKGLYYDRGLLEELQMEASEIQESTFDENLFDLDDVDQFGRPLPGVFQQNLGLRVKAQGHGQRQSAVTSPGSDGSNSTAHTSVSVGAQPNALVEVVQLSNSSAFSASEDKHSVSSGKIVMTSTSPAPTHESYQMALLEGVQKAAASGWKSRWNTEEDEDEDEDTARSEAESEARAKTEYHGDVQVMAGVDERDSESFPARDYDFTITSPTTASQPSTAGLPSVDSQPRTGGLPVGELSRLAESIEDSRLDDKGFEDNYLDDVGFDDDDYFDDDFIAEANAEALAYDDEGFYGTEFGFYSAPPPIRSTGPSISEIEPPTGKIFLGGYFGPSNIVSRTLSGRVLKEPVLTPITEISETPGQYSNRNSMLSMGLPSAPLGSAPLGSASFGDFRSSILSPGLAHVGGGSDGLDFSLGSLHSRNKTFSGSQISLNSSRDGSPRSERAPMHSERTEVLSPMPWDIIRPKSQLSMNHDRKNLLWSPTDPTGSPGYPPPPLFSPPPIPQPACPPVMEDDGEQTVRNTPATSEGELSPAGTFGLDPEESRMSFETLAESPRLFRPESSSSVDRNIVAFGANHETAAELEKFKRLGGIDETTGLEQREASQYVLLSGPVLAHGVVRRGSF